MLKEKAGIIAGQIWNALNGTEGLTHKQIKKATKLTDKDFFLGLGWLLREGKVSTSMEKELVTKQAGSGKVKVSASILKEELFIQLV